MRIRVGGVTDIGRARERNEDGYLVEPPLYAVADGMGGHKGGEVASRLALEALERAGKEAEAALGEQVREANRIVYERSMLDRAVAGMGTTLTAALVEGSRIRFAHVGDSRAYLLRDGRLRRLTEDHTLVHRMVQQGEITEEEATEHPLRSVLTRALGTEPDVAVDEAIVEVRPGDRLLLCTDGLTGMVEEARIAELLRGSEDPQEAAERLVHQANEAGGHDNITVVVLDVAEGEEGGAAGEEPGGGSAGEQTTTTAAPERRVGRPPERRAGPVLRRVAIGLGIALALAAIGLVGLRIYLDRQWYVGVSDGNVSVFQGVPTSVAGFDLHRVVLETDIAAADALDLAYYQDLREGITADSRPAAMDVVEQIREDLAAGREATAGGGGA